MSSNFFSCYFVRIVGESGAISSEHAAANTINVQENCGDAGIKKDEKNIPEASDVARSSSENIVSLADALTNPSAGTISETMGISAFSYPIKKETKKKVAFVAIKQPAPSTRSQSSSRSHLPGTEMDDKKDPFFSLLTGGNK